MARKLRIEFPGALYHVIVRGNNRERIFFLEGEKEKYLEIVRHYRKKYGFKLYAYAIMDNHAHLLVETSSVPLSKIMQGIQQVFTMYYNDKYDRVGHVFQQRYKANLCDKENYLLALVRYIHQNPVCAGIIEGLDYEWSSHLDYINPGKKSIVDVNYILMRFHNQSAEAVRLYLAFMGKESDQGDVPDTDPGSFYLEDSNEKIKDETNCFGPAVQYAYDLNRLLALVNEETGFPRGVIRSGIRRRDVVEARRLFAHLAYCCCAHKQAEIARYLGVSSPAVTKLLAGIRKDNSYQQQLLQLERRIAGDVKQVN